MVGTPDPAYAFAQATIDAGQGQLSEIARKSTEVSLNVSQAANAAALATQDYNRRRKMDLDFQATVISLNIAQAAATQKVIAQQTKMARDATVAAQNRADAALDAKSLQTAQAGAAQTAYPLTLTASAHAINVTETAQALGILNAQTTQDAQRIAALAAYPLTATPLARTQAALVMQQYEREQQAFVEKVVKPMIPVVAVLDLLLFVVLVIVLYRRTFPAPWLPRPRLTGGSIQPVPPLVIDGVITNHNPQRPTISPPALMAPASPGAPDEKSGQAENDAATGSPAAD
jgi:hypothetical protein